MKMHGVVNVVTLRQLREKFFCYDPILKWNLCCYSKMKSILNTDRTSCSTSDLKMCAETEAINWIGKGRKKSQRTNNEEICC